MGKNGENGGIGDIDLVRFTRESTLDSSGFSKTAKRPSNTFEVSGFWDPDSRCFGKLTLSPIVDTKLCVYPLVNRIKNGA